MSSKPSRRNVIAGAVATVAVLSINKTFAESTTVHEINIESFEFEPQHVTVQVGDRIRWTNKDLAPHTATANEFGWDTGELTTGQSAEITVTADMETQYFCAYHPHMKGEIEFT